MTVNLQMRLPEPIVERLRSLAADHSLSVAKYVITLVNEAWRTSPAGKAEAAPASTKKVPRPQIDTPGEHEGQDGWRIRFVPGQSIHKIIAPNGDVYWHPSLGDGFPAGWLQRTTEDWDLRIERKDITPRRDAFGECTEFEAAWVRAGLAVDA